MEKQETLKISYSNKTSISAFLIINLVKGLNAPIHVDKDGKTGPLGLNVKTHFEGKPIIHGDIAAVSAILQS